MRCFVLLSDQEYWYAEAQNDLTRRLQDFRDQKPVAKCVLVLQLFYVYGYGVSLELAVLGFVKYMLCTLSYELRMNSLFCIVLFNIQAITSYVFVIFSMGIYLIFKFM